MRKSPARHGSSPLIPEPNPLQVIPDDTASSSDGGSREEEALYGRADRLAPAQESTGQTIAEVCRRLGVSEQTFYRWKKKLGAMGVAEVGRLKQLEDENAKLKQLVADLSLDKAILQDALRKRADARSGVRAGRVRTRCLPDDGATRLLRASHVTGEDPLLVRQTWTGGASHADQRDRLGAPELGLGADPRAAVTRGLAGQPQAHGASISHGGAESQAKSTTPQKVGGESRPIGRADAPGRALEHGLHARPAA